MNNVCRASRGASQTKDHKTASLWCMFIPCTPFVSSLFLPIPRSLLPISLLSPITLPSSSFSPSFLLFLQAQQPSKPSGHSQGILLCGWEPQLCWSVRCYGPLGQCSGWKMASSWGHREACQAFHATAWLETPWEVNRDTLTEWRIWLGLHQGIKEADLITGLLRRQQILLFPAQRFGKESEIHNELRGAE